MILVLRSVFLSNIFWELSTYHYWSWLFQKICIYIHVNSTCSRCCWSLPSFFEGCAPDLSQELGDGNEAEFQQYDCPMIQEFFVFWESAGGWGRCFVDWMVVFSKKCSVMMVGCCRKKMLLQVFSYVFSCTAMPVSKWCQVPFAFKHYHEDFLSPD